MNLKTTIVMIGAVFLMKPLLAQVSPSAANTPTPNYAWKEVHNERWQFSAPRPTLARLMDNYKTESVIVAGMQKRVNPGDIDSFFIMQSTDLGKTWNYIYKRSTPELNSIWFQINHPSPNHIIALNERDVWVNNAWAIQPVLLRSENNFATYTFDTLLFQAGDNVMSMDFKESNGIITYRTDTVHKLMVSNDYGASWQTQILPDSARHAIAKIIDNNSYFIRSNSTRYIATTHNNGSTWDVFPGPAKLGSLGGIHVLNKDTIVSAYPEATGVGNTSKTYIVKSVDGGLSWQTVLDKLEDRDSERNGVNAIKFANSTHGAAAGTFGVIYLTEDGGETWDRHFLDHLWDSENPLLLPPFSGVNSIVYAIDPLRNNKVLIVLTRTDKLLVYDFTTVGINAGKLPQIKVPMFPNPANDKITLDLSGLVKPSLQLYDLNGRLLYSRKEAATDLEHIDVSNLSPGIYFVSIVTETGISRQKFVKY